MIDEDVSRRTIALSLRTGKLTARALAYALQAAGRKIQKERRAHQTPHGRQSVKKLMAHLTNGETVDFDILVIAVGVRPNTELVSDDPTMVSDGLLHYQKVDLPMGEFWLNSPTHDKPNDMLDAISGYISKKLSYRNIILP